MTSTSEEGRVRPQRPLWLLPAIDFVAGVGAGIVGIVAGYPMDTIKTRMQIGLEKNVFSALSGAIKKDGFLSLYRGLSSPIAGYAFMSGLSFGGFGWASRQLKERDVLNHSPVLQSMLAGTCSGALYCAASTPVDRVKIVMQAGAQGGRSYSSSLACALDIKRRYGARYLYWGLSTNLPREMLGSSLWFGVYHFVKAGVMDIAGTTEPTFPMLLASGSLSGSLTWFIVFPVDVIRSRVFQELDPLNPTYKNGIDAFRKLYAQEGLAWCYRGYSATLIRAIPVGGIIMSLNETFGNFLREL